MTRVQNEAGAEPVQPGAIPGLDGATPEGDASPSMLEDAGAQPGPSEGPDAGGEQAGDGGALDGQHAFHDAEPADGGAAADATPDATPNPTADAAPGDGAPPRPVCVAPTRECGGACVNVTSSAEHCGQCGSACGGGQTCSQSACVSPQVVPSGCTSKTHAGRDYLFCNEARSWSDARRSCLSAKMDLARLESPSETDFAQQAGGAWFGASDLVREGGWRAIVPGSIDGNDGAAVDFSNWAFGEPNNLERCTSTILPIGGCVGGELVDEDCAFVRDDGRWLDMECALRRNYVCEAY